MISKRKLNPVEHLVAGTCAGLVSTVALFPLDTIKVRYQVDETLSLSSPKRMVSAVRRIIEVEGWRGLYQGLSAGMYGAGLAWGGYFFFYEQAKKRWLGNGETTSTFHHMAAACEAGTLMVGLTNPIWLIKIRMQLQLREAAASNDTALVKPYKNFSDALRTIVREEGFLALYKGSVPALLLVSHGAVQFVVYEKLKSMEAQRVSSGGKPSGSFQFLAMGAIAKIAASVTTYPLQVRLSLSPYVSYPQLLFSYVLHCLYITVSM
jgi:solute carrier family 25 (mitochondrial folate transporter), member 32